MYPDTVAIQSQIVLRVLFVDARTRRAGSLFFDLFEGQSFFLIEASILLSDFVGEIIGMISPQPFHSRLSSRLGPEDSTASFVALTLFVPVSLIIGVSIVMR